MSWTSEFEPPPARPTTEPGIEEPELNADDIDEGPLDPSVFDGLFDDLGGASSADAEEAEEATPAEQGDSIDNLLDELLEEGEEGAVVATDEPIPTGAATGAEAHAEEGLADPHTEIDDVGADGGAETPTRAEIEADWPDPPGEHGMVQSDGADAGLDDAAATAARIEPDPSVEEPVGYQPQGYDGQYDQHDGQPALDDVGSWTDNGNGHGNGADAAMTTLDHVADYPDVGYDDAGNGTTTEDISFDPMAEGAAPTGQPVSTDAVPLPPPDAEAPAPDGAADDGPTRFDGSQFDPPHFDAPAQPYTPPAQFEPDAHADQGFMPSFDGTPPMDAAAFEGTPAFDGPESFDAPPSVNGHQSYDTPATVNGHQSFGTPAAFDEPSSFEAAPSFDAGPTFTASPVAEVQGFHPATTGEAAVARFGEHGQTEVAPGRTEDVQYPTMRKPKKPRRMASFVAAVVVGATLGGGAAVGIFQLLTGGDGDELAAAEDEAGDAGERPDGTDVGGQTEAAALVDGQKSTLSSVRFEPGTTTLTAPAEAALDTLAAAMVESPGLPLLVEVRTYSETTASENLSLSRQQADAVVGHLASAGADVTGAVTVGAGSPPLGPSQPVENFVVIDGAFGQFDFGSLLGDDSPFGLGVDPASGRLRSEGLGYLDRLGQAMVDRPEASVSVAGYSFDQGRTAGNREFAAGAAQAVSEYLTNEFQIDPGRIEPIALGEATFIVPDAVGNHIMVRWGQTAGLASAITALAQDTIEFDAGSTELDAAARAVLDEVADLAVDADQMVIIDGHTFSEDDSDANLDLSGKQSETVAKYLLDLGIPAERLRWFGNGDLRQYRSSERNNRIVISIIG